MTKTRPGSGAGADRRDWSPAGALGWADLVRARDAGGPALLEAAAALLGLKRQGPEVEPRVVVVETLSSGHGKSSVREAFAPTPGCDPMPRWEFFYPAAIEAQPDDDRPDATQPQVLAADEVPALPEWTARPPPARYAWLNRWEAVLPRLRRQMAVRTPGRALDTREIVRRLGRGEILDQLPRRPRRRWGTVVQIIEDRSRRLTPYWRDQALVRQRLLRLLPRHAVSHGLVDEVLALPRALMSRAPGQAPGQAQPRFVDPVSGRGQDAGQGWADWLVPPPGGTLLVLGDLGCLSAGDARTRDFWAHLGRRAVRAGCRPVALIPLAPAACGGELARHWSLIGWERAALPLRPEQLAAQVERLLDALSATVRVEPGLLRDVRRLLGLDVAAEGAFWQHGAVIGDSSVAATLDPDELKRRRPSFHGVPDGMGKDGWEHTRRDVWESVRAWRARLPGEVYLAEAALLAQEARTLLSPEEHAWLDDFFDTLERIAGAGAGGAPRGAEAWFRRLEGRAIKTDEPIWHRPSVQRLWALVHDKDSGALPEPPPGFLPEAIGADPRAQVVAADMAQVGDELLVQAAMSSEPIGASPLGRVLSRNRWLTLQAVGVAVEAADSFWAPGQAPSWAHSWGQDEYGPWASFSVPGKDGTPVLQRLRWIPPGSFLMGSPKDEPERYDGEGPQHEVRIAQGFWLMDTACTQALWEAVMGENPARFKGAERPVEQVSWDEVQRFIARLNERVPGLELRLPSEAEWEYACRAGTETPFSFGANITTGQVNYDVDFLYAGAPKGEVRGETVAVASLPANRWGLYEMHGNVCEWVQDNWHENYEGAPRDGSAWESDSAGADRVIRGGSWGINAPHCRSAFRLGFSYRDSNLGFRCARAQS